MRKKLLTVALAATMAVASVFSAFAEDVDCTGWWAAHSAGTEITTEGVEIDFHTQSYDNATNNWNTPIYVLYSGDEAKVNGAGYKEYFVARSDAYGWTPTSNTGPEENDNVGKGIDKFKSEGNAWEVSGVDGIDWASWLTANKSGVDCKIKATRNGNNVVVEFTNNGVTSKATIPVEDGKKAYLSVSGELCKITNLTAKANAGTPATPDPRTAPSDDKKNEPTTAAPAGSKDNVTPSKTGDTAAVAVVAIVALGAAVAVVASKKKVTE